MTLSISDPAFLFPGISLLFLAYTNRYLALASIVRSLNKDFDDNDNSNRIQQIQSIQLRITLIKYMQASGIISFLCCVLAMLTLIYQQQGYAEILFIGSLILMIMSLLLSLIEILQSDKSLKIELNRTRRQD